MTVRARARRKTCPSCGVQVAIRGGYPDKYWGKHTDPETGLVCGQSNMYVLPQSKGGPAHEQEVPYEA